MLLSAELSMTTHLLHRTKELWFLRMNTFRNSQLESWLNMCCLSHGIVPLSVYRIDRLHETSIQVVLGVDTNCLNWGFYWRMQCCRMWRWAFKRCSVWTPTVLTEVFTEECSIVEAVLSVDTNCPNWGLYWRMQYCRMWRRGAWFRILGHTYRYTSLHQEKLFITVAFRTSNLENIIAFPQLLSSKYAKTMNFLSS
jgi:hypothetical protein